MNNANELMNRINERYSSMSKGQKLLSTYITDNYDKAVFLTAEKLGKVVGVSESTVVRFATHLGYRGYPEFQKALEELVRNKLNSIQRMEVTYGRISQSKILETVLQADAEKIKTTLEQIDQNAFELALDIILHAKNIYIVGIRSCAPLASFLSFYFNLIFDNVHLLHTNSSSELFEQMVRISEEDVIFGISFPRYSMRTLKAMEFANNRNAKVITLTDSVHSPMNLYSSCNLIAKSDMASIVDSLVAPLSVINALIVALCMRKQDEVAKTVGKSRSAITNAIRLLSLPQSVIDLLSEGVLTAGHARALLTLKTCEDIEKVANKVIENFLSVREVEKLCKDILENGDSEKKKVKIVRKRNPFFDEVEISLKEILGRRVKVKDKPRKNKGVLEIEFYDSDDLANIAKCLGESNF